MFQYFNSFMAVEPNSLDCLILDEAHRIRETSVNRWTKAEFRSGRPQIDELIAAARVPVFLLDEFQVVRPGEQGTVEDIEKNAQARGIRVEKINLDAQFRCGGSEEYLLWVKRLLGLTPGGPIQWTGDPHFDVEVVDSPAEMEALLETRITDGYSARIAAGYCWPWSDPRQTARSCAMCRSADGRVRGTSRGTGLSAAPRRRRCGPRTPRGSTRSDASTPPKVSSTTTPASSSGPTWCGVTDGWVDGPFRQQGPRLPKPHHGRRFPGRSTDPQCLQGLAHPRYARSGDPFGGSADECSPWGAGQQPDLDASSSRGHSRSGPWNAKAAAVRTAPKVGPARPTFVGPHHQPPSSQYQRCGGRHRRDQHSVSNGDGVGDGRW